MEAPDRRTERTKLWLGVAVIAWGVLFVAGLTVPSSHYREHLSAYSRQWEPPKDSKDNPLAAAVSALTEYVKSSMPQNTEKKFAPTLLSSLFALFMTLLCYTPTNVVLMCMCASIIGSAGVRLSNSAFGPRKPSQLNGAKEQSSSNTQTASNTSDSKSEAEKQGAEKSGPTEITQIAVVQPGTAIADAASPAKPGAGNGNLEPEKNPTIETEGQTYGVGAVPGLCVFLLLTSGMILIDGVDSWINTTPEFYGKFAATASLFSIAAGTHSGFIYDLASLFSVSRYRPKVNGKQS